jgi:predicted permease
MLGEFFRRLRYLMKHRQFDEELESDMEFHREMAAREGRGNFGNLLRLREQSREAWGWMWLDRLGQDLHYAGRMLWKSPGFTITAVLVLALGIGVNVTAFSAFNLLVLKSMPVRDPDSLVRLQRHAPCCSASEMTYPSLVFYREHSKTLQAVIGTLGGPPMTLAGNTQSTSNVFVTANYFSELGETAALGRLLDPGSDEASGAPQVAVLSYGFWQRQFGANPAIVGKTIRLNRKPVTVIGVLPNEFASLDEQHADVWLPIMQQPYFVEGSTALTDTSLDRGTVRMFGRLAPGVTAKVAEQELRGLTNEWRKQHPQDVWGGEYLKTEPAGHTTVVQPETYLVVTMVGILVMLILAVACANLGGLLMARGVTREREIGIRIAIGAGTKRIFRQLFTESLLLAVLGSAAGMALGYGVLRVLMAKFGMPAWIDAAPDWRVMLFAGGLALVSSILFGLAPALQIARQRQRKPIARQILMGTQVAASAVLLIVAGLLVRAVHHAIYTNPGFGYEQVLSINPGLEGHGYTPIAARAYLEELESRLRAVPGVTSVGLSSMPPLGHGRISTIGTEIGGRAVEMYPYRVDTEFFRTMSIPMMRGRNFLPTETNAVIVSDSLARRQWPGEDPIGKQFWDKDTVIGVVGSARMVAPNDTDATETYHAAQIADMPGMIVVVKSMGAPDDLVPTVKTIVENLDPKLTPEIRLLKAAFQENMKGPERIALMVSLLGILAVSLATLGIVGLVAYSVSQRMKEIAIRIALGARRMQVLSAVLAQFSWPVALGLITGVGLAAGLSRTLRKTLYGLENLDPLSYAMAIALLAVVVGAAALLPARRALRLDLARILHYE